MLPATEARAGTGEIRLTKGWKLPLQVGAGHASDRVTTAPSGPEADWYPGGAEDG